MTHSDNAVRSGHPDLAELEAEFELRKAEWEERLAADFRATRRRSAFWMPGRSRKARRSAAALERARLAYTSAWRALEDARGLGSTGNVSTSRAALAPTPLRAETIP